MALADAIKEVLFLRQVWRFLLDIGMPCIAVFEENHGAVHLAQNPITNSNFKHIDVRHDFVTELVGSKEISIIHEPSPFQHADFVTEAISRDSFELHRSLAMNLW